MDRHKLFSINTVDSATSDQFSKSSEYLDKHPESNQDEFKRTVYDDCQIEEFSGEIKKQFS